MGSAPPPFPRRLPPLCHRPPPFLPQRRLCFSRRRGCGGGSWPDDRRRAARVFQSPLFSLSRVDHAGKRQGGERNSLRHPRLYPEVTLLLCVFFLGFSRFVIGFASPCRSSSIHRRPSRRTRLLLRPPGCSNDVRDQATLPVSSPFQAVAPLAAGLRQAGARSASAPPTVLARTSPPMFLKKDVVATPDLSATLAATCAVATP